MKISELNYADTGAFSSLVLDYLNHSPKLKPFYHRFPETSSFLEQIREKTFTEEQRKQLHLALSKQYQSVPQVAGAVQQNIDLLLQPNTYTVTTGHQLNIFTGPLYFIYKIVTAINTCKALQQAYPQYNFVPVYWMATEDHDFAEINHFNLFGKRYEWQTEQSGAVGRYTTEGLEQVLEALPEQYPLFKQAYTNSANLADATRYITHELFGEYGLVSIDGDDAALKKALIPVLEKELLEQASNQQVNQVNETLAAHYKPQVYSRPINLFYLDEGLRERIEQEGEHTYKVLNTDLTFTKEEILKLVQEHPEKFSPNVILRPLYQELILPNLAYIGGGAEVAYWMQLGQVFQQNKVPFPILMLRNSALYISRANASRMHKLGLLPQELFKDFQELKKQLAAKLHDVEVNLQSQQNAIAEQFKQIEELAAAIDPTVAKTVAAEAQKVQNSIQNLEKKISKAQDTKFDTVFKQLENLKEKLFPGGALQERVDNLLTYQTNNPDFIPAMVAAFEPLAFKFTILEEEE